MFKNQSLEMFAEAKKIEMERLASKAHPMSRNATSSVRDPVRHFDIMMRVALRPKLSVDISLVRGLS